MKIQATIEKAIKNKKELSLTFSYAGLKEVKNRFQPYILGTDSSNNVFVWGIFATNTKPRVYFLQNIISAEITDATFELKEDLYYLKDEEEQYTTIADGFALSTTPPPAREKAPRAAKRQLKGPKLSRIAECTKQLESAKAEIEELKKALAEKDKMLNKLQKAK